MHLKASYHNKENTELVFSLYVYGKYVVHIIHYPEERMSYMAKIIHQCIRGKQYDHVLDKTNS